MALKLDYFVRETATNLVRNISLTIATMLTVALSLSLVGLVLVFRQAVDNATARWQDGIEFIVFMNPDATEGQITDIGRALDESPLVESHSFVDKEATYEEFQRIFAKSPQLVESVTPDILPPSYRVVPTDKSAEVVLGLRDEFQTKAGVREAVAAEETIRTFQSLSSKFQLAMLAGAIVAIVAATMLIGNTIRMAMFARRREVEVMKLVGASNWFIRVPFMLEGIIAGLIGSAAAVGSVVGMDRLLARISTGDALALLSALDVASDEVRAISFIVIGLGIGIGAIGSAIALVGFLDV